jgi:hypothetical protein
VRRMNLNPEEAVLQMCGPWQFCWAGACSWHRSIYAPPYSPPFFAKGWPQYELDGLVTMAVSGAQVLLPLWHGVSKDEVMRQSPSLADKVALRTSDYTIDEIAKEITSVVRPG